MTNHVPKGIKNKSIYQKKMEETAWGSAENGRKYDVTKMTKMGIITQIMQDFIYKKSLHYLHLIQCVYHLADQQ